MVSEKADIREFVFRELRHCSDLSTLTLGILRRRYLEHVGRESLSVEHKQLLKQIVEEELLKMQANDSDVSLVKSAEPSQKQNKRKREEDKYEAQMEEKNDDDDVVGRKKRARFESVLPDSPDSGIEKAVHEEPLKDDDDDDDDDKDEHDGESDEELAEKMEMKKKAHHTVRGNRKGRLSSESEEEKKSVRKGKAVGRKEVELDSFEDSGKEDENQGRMKSRGQRKTTRVSSDSEGRARCKQAGKSRAQSSEIQESVEEPDSPESEAVRRVQKEVFGSSSESEEESEGTKAQGKKSDGGAREDEANQKKGSANASSDEELEGKGETRDDGKSDSESDSSSLPSLEEEELSKKHKQEEKKKKSGSKRRNSDESDGKARGGKLDEENKAVTRLKRYIALCGVRRNYKKLLAGCRSVKAKVAVLKKELEELGVEGQPSIEKCKKARLKREEAQEIAELDVSNIITTQGRSRRRAAGLWPLPRGPSSSPPSAFKRAVNSDSDSENGSADRGRKRATDWGNLKGIISDDADSD